MGQRLVIVGKKNHIPIFNIYYHWSAYTSSSIYVAVHAEGDRFKTGFTYELDDTITCEMVDEKIFYYNEGEVNEIS